MSQSNLIKLAHPDFQTFRRPLEGKELYKITAKALETRKSEEFETFWKKTVKQSEDLGLEVPKGTSINDVPILAR